MTFSCETAYKLGLCKGGECCGVVPLSKDVVAKNIDKMHGHIQEHRVVGDEVVLITEDLLCAFLNRETKRCEIYETRPDVCRRYATGRDYNGEENVLMMCPHLKPSGNPRSEANRKHLLRRVKQVEDMTFKEMEKRHDEGGTTNYPIFKRR
jgi:Fe-S-cluster containining protein